MPTAHFYARVSTAEQQDSLVAQAGQMRGYYEAFLKGRGFAEGKMHVDRGVSGAVPFFRRPAGRACHEALKAGDAVVVAKLDRGFRNCKDALLCLETWGTAGVGLHLLDIRVDTSTAVGKLMLSVFAAFAEWERTRIGERTREARIAGDAIRSKKLMPGATLQNRPPRGWRWLKLARGWRDIVPIAPDLCQIKRAIRLKYKVGWPLTKVWCEYNREDVRRRSGKKWNWDSLCKAVLQCPKVMAAKGVAWANPDDDDDLTFVKVGAGRGEQSDLPGDGGGPGAPGPPPERLVGGGAAGQQVPRPDGGGGRAEVPVEEGGPPLPGAEGPGGGG